MENQIKRQLEELKSLDKVFPDPTRTVGCYVQVMGEGKPAFAQITACPKQEKVAMITDCKVEIRSLSDETKSTQSAE